MCPGPVIKPYSESPRSPPTSRSRAIRIPGPETAYVLEGSLTLDVEGQPQRSLKAGQTSFVPAGTPHSGRAGPNGAKILADWVVEKGKPLASPAK